MKVRLIVAICVAVLIIAGGALEEIYIKKTFSEFSEKLEEILSSPDETYTIEEVEELYNWWEKRHKTLELTMPHALLNEIEITYGELIGAVNAEDYDSASALLNRIKSTSDAYSDTLGLRLGNII